MRTPTERKTPSDFGILFEPSEALEPILAKPVRDALTEWLTEVWSEDELRAVGIGARRRAIFDGPPGVGKTTLAHHLAARLGLPMLAVRPERVISKWIGETGWNLGTLFDLASDEDNPIVLFLDELDALSPQRRKSETSAGDEKNAEINTLLQRIEQYKGFLIAATNFADQIDQAIWRRFDIHITIDLPGQREREHILSRYLAPYGLPPRSLTAMAEAIETASPALIRALCEGLKRQIIIGPKLNSDMRREAVVSRIVTTVHPHASAGKPRLWSRGSDDPAIRAMPWPMPLAIDVPTMSVTEPASQSATVTPIRREADLR